MRKLSHFVSGESVSGNCVRQQAREGDLGDVILGLSTLGTDTISSTFTYRIVCDTNQKLIDSHMINFAAHGYT